MVAYRERLNALKENDHFGAVNMLQRGKECADKQVILAFCTSGIAWVVELEGYMTEMQALRFRFKADWEIWSN